MAYFLSSHKQRQLIMPKIVSKPHNTHVLGTIPMKQKQRKTLGEYRCGNGQKPSEG